jgi:glycosyltransferase involved in cell wall biosynthesis
MTSTREISVIIPAYNAATTLPRAVQSVLGQGLPDVEVIIVDDGSSDDPGTALGALMDAGDIHVIRQENAGPGAARNTGLHRAKGRMIVFLDADDELLEGSMRRRRDVLEENPDVGLVFHDIFRPEKEGDIGSPLLHNERFIDKFRPAVIRQHGDVYILGPRYFELAIKHFPYIWTSSVMLRSDVAHRVGTFWTDLRAGEDIDFWFRVAALGPIAYIDAPLTHWHHTDSNLTKTSVGFFANNAIFYESLRPRVQEIPGLEAHLDRRIARYHFLAGYVAFDDGPLSHSRSHLLRAVKNQPFNSRYWIYFLLSLLPELVFFRLRGLKQKIKG